MKLYIDQNEYDFTPGETVMDVLRRNGIHLSAPCGGKGTCGKCCITINGRVALACRTAAEDEMTVHLLREDAVAVVEEGIKGEVDITIDAGHKELGIACDIGTTTVVCHLIHLSTGARLATVSGANAQKLWGADVISRIQAASEGALKELQNAVISQISGFIDELCHSTGKEKKDITAMTVAGNTVMCHLFSGLSPESIGKAPYEPLSLFGDVQQAEGLGLGFDGHVYIIPAISGYVGGDITAGVLACGMDGVSLLMDVGTNGEMVLCHNGRLLCCAAAAGPAFEGAEITCGATARAGAVSSVKVRDGRLELTTIGGVRPNSICGSGLIDALAAMLTLGAIDETGRLLDEDETEVPQFLRQVDGEDVFALTDDASVYITQKDIRKLQLAKAAIAAGAGVLLDEAGIDEDQIERVLLAGGFGSRLDPGSAAAIGLIPSGLLPVTQSVGNAAGEGAVMALLSLSARDELTRIQSKMEYIELSTHKGFTDRFVDKMMLE